jgi:DnaJ-class molecular chaperone
MQLPGLWQIILIVVRPIQMGRDFYAILGVPRDADAATLKKAYRALAMKWHPDKNPGNQDEAQVKFQEIGEAYETLSNPEKRAVFDRYGEEGLRPSGGLSGASAHYTFARAEDLFRSFFSGFPGFDGFPSSMFFGGGGFDHGFGEGVHVIHMGPDGPFGPFASSHPRGPPRRRQLEPREIKVSCPLEQLFAGASKDLRVQRLVDGTQNEVMLHVDIDAGAANGARYVFPGQGDAPPGCEPQDIVFVVNELSHPRFVRHGADLVATMRIALKESLCGVDRALTGIDGAEIPIVCNRIVKPHTEIRLPGQGMTRERGGRGTLTVRFEIVWPDDLEDEMKEVIGACLPDLDQ